MCRPLDSCLPWHNISHYNLYPIYLWKINSEGENWLIPARMKSESSGWVQWPYTHAARRCILASIYGKGLRVLVNEVDLSLQQGYYQTERAPEFSGMYKASNILIHHVTKSPLNNRQIAWELACLASTRTYTYKDYSPSHFKLVFNRVYGNQSFLTPLPSNAAKCLWCWGEWPSLQMASDMVISMEFEKLLDKS